MTEQQQIDWLKQEVATLKQQMFGLTQGVGMAVNCMETNPQCGKCGMFMSAGSTCANKASECVMGIGEIEQCK